MILERQIELAVTFLCQILTSWIKVGKQMPKDKAQTHLGILADHHVIEWQLNQQEGMLF